jgi:hypothetical protein
MARSWEEVPEEGRETADDYDVVYGCQEGQPFHQSIPKVAVLWASLAEGD